LATVDKGTKLDLSKVKHFVLDECDRMLAELSMRRDVQRIFTLTPHDKQVLMFSATLDKNIRPVCLKFCQDVSTEYYVDRSIVTLVRDGEFERCISLARILATTHFFHYLNRFLFLSTNPSRDFPLVGGHINRQWKST